MLSITVYYTACLSPPLLTGNVLAQHDLYESAYALVMPQGFTSSWYLERVSIEQEMTGLSWDFNVRDWVKGGSAGKSYKLRGLSRESSRSGSMTRAGNPLRSSGDGGLKLRMGGIHSAGADESFDVSSDPSTPVAAAPAGSSKPAVPTRALYSAYADESMSLSFDTEDDLPIHGLSGDIKPGPSRLASNIPAGMGVVLEDDIEEVDEALVAGPVTALGAVGSSSAGARGKPPVLASLTSPKLEGGGLSPAPAARSLSGRGSRSGGISMDDETAAGARRPPLPPTPTGNRPQRMSSASGLNELLGESADSLDGSFTSQGSGRIRKVRTSGGGGPPGGLLGGLEPELSRASIDSDAMSDFGSERSLSRWAPEGVKPPSAGTR